MQVGIFAKTFTGTSPQVVVAAARAAGFDAVQYNMACSGLPTMPDAIDPSTVAAVAQAAKTLPLCAVSGTYNMIDPNPEARAQGVSRLRVLAAHARAMGTDMVTLCTGTNHPTDQWAWHAENGSARSWKALCVEMETAIGIAEEHDIRLGIEPELANVVSDAPAADKLLIEMQSDRLRIVLDPANLFETATAKEQRALVAQAIDMLGDRISMAHAKDRDATGAFATAGQGVLDYDGYLRALRGVGFDGPLVAHGLAAEEAPGVAVFLRERLAAI